MASPSGTAIRAANLPNFSSAPLYFSQPHGAGRNAGKPPGISPYLLIQPINIREANQAPYGESPAKIQYAKSMADLLGAILCTNEQETVLWEPRIKPIPALTSQVRRRRGNVNSGSPFKYWETQMRKSIILVIAIAMCSILSGKTWAGKVSLGKHNADEIETICNSVGGAFWSKKWDIRLC
jgi:hypothetical protein